MKLMLIFTSLLFFKSLTAKTLQSTAVPNLNFLSGDKAPLLIDETSKQSSINASENLLYHHSRNSDSSFWKAIIENYLQKNLKKNFDWNVSSLLLSLLQNTLSDSKRLKSIVTDGLGLHEDFVKPLMKLNFELDKIRTLSDGDNYEEDLSENILRNNVVIHDNPNDGKNKTIDINWQILRAMSNVFAEEFANRSVITLPIDLQPQLKDSQEHDFTAANAWMIVKSTWQRIISYVKEEHSINRFMQLTPVKIIDRILSIGDDLSIAGFLAQKLHPDFAKFLSAGIRPHLGPFKDFNTFHDYSKQYNLDGIIDYLLSPDLANNMNVLSRFISAYFDDSFSDDVVDQYITFISLNNTDLYNFYKSIVNHQKTKHATAIKNDRQKREDMSKTRNSFRYDGYDFQPMKYKSESDIIAERDGGYEDSGHSGYSSGYGGGHSGYGGGYGSGGGGGYGGGSTNTDPAVLLSSIGLGALLGFLLFRLINGSRFVGKRDINDGSLSLLLSDLPEDQVPWGTDAERMKRDVSYNRSQEEGDLLQSPVSFKGEVWSNDPLVGGDRELEEFDADDMADHLNHLWMVYNETKEVGCVQSHLCDVVAKGTAEYLTGKDSSIAILLASVSSMMGVEKAGQMVDDVVQTLVVGSNYACPIQSQCLHSY